MRRLALLLALLASFGARAEESPRTLYLLNCSGCHGVDGKGDTDADVPPLAYIGAMLNDPDGRRYVVNVAGVLSSGLTASETAGVLNWIRRTFADSPAQPPSADFDVEEVRKLSSNRPADIVALRRQVMTRLARGGVDIPGYPWP